MTSPAPRRWVGEAPAKVNLLLRIFEREPSGYHRLETVFQALELADRVEIEVGEESGAGGGGGAEARGEPPAAMGARGVEGERPEGEGSGSSEPDSREEASAKNGPDTPLPPVHLEVVGDSKGELGPADQNLAVRAARRFQEAILEKGGDPASLSIRLEKRIPHGAGLGGGSSDAATVLLGANALAGEPLSRPELLAIGAGLGADVAFFLCGALRALGTGRGEVLTPLDPLPQREVVLLVPAEGIATGWAYQTLAAAREAGASVVEVAEAEVAEMGSRGGGKGAGSAGSSGAGAGARAGGPPVVPAAGAGAGGAVASVGGKIPRSWDAVAASALNDFEEVLHPLRPQLAELKALLARHGAAPALLSGSGSVVFGVFSSPDAAQAAAREAEGAGIRAIRTRTAG